MVCGKILTVRLSCGDINCQERKEISDILPSSEDETALKEELAVIVSRILTSYDPVYAGLVTVWSISHQYSTQSAFRSEIQDTYDELFKSESHREKGTLHNLKWV